MARARSQSVQGKRLGRYRLVEHLADGGMAEIFLARREEDGFAKDLVLKVLQDRFVDNAEVVAMFLEEARLAAGLRHPNIVDVYDVGEDDGVRFIAMEFIDGRTLTDVVTRSFEVAEALPLAFAVHIVAEVATGLSYLEAGLSGRGRAPGIVHRDISPTNIVIGWAGETKIIDFGIARKIAGTKEEGTRPGKVSYMSPEQVKGLPLDIRSDLFSLGTILYEITVGRRLWRGAPEVVMRRIVEEAPVPPTYVQRDYPPALESIVLRALAKRPEDRFATAADMLGELEAFLGHRTGPRPSSRSLGEYVRGLYAPSARVTEKGARRAENFQDDEAADPADPMTAPLDFDRALRPGSGAALAHALRGADAFEVAADVTGVAAIPGISTGSSRGSGAITSKTPPPVSLRTPAPVSLRNGATTLSPPNPGPTWPARARDDQASERPLGPLESAGRGRAFVIGLILVAVLGGLYFALQGL
jgi:serine/threonine protein kinase